jgi:hypothetical protein
MQLPATKFAQALKSIADVLLLPAQLFIVVKMLPRAATTRSKVLASCSNASFGRLKQTNHAGFDVIASARVYLSNNYVAGHGSVNEVHKTIAACNGLAFKANRFNAQFVALSFRLPLSYGMLWC